MKNVMWFDELNKGNLAEAGGKGSNLGEMSQSGFPIPPGFVVTSGSYFKHLAANNLVAPMTAILNALDVNDNDKLDEASVKIKKLITDGKVPQDIEDDIIRNYKKLNERAGREVYVAVRSSATAEDLPTASFAGQQSTYLNIKGPEHVVAAVKDCWASLFEARAIYYRVQNHFDHMKVGLAAVVQMMVQSEKAGVIFTVDPLYQDPNLISIEAGFGLGETVVSGEITPDTYRIDKERMEIVDKKISKQTWMLIKLKDKNERVQIKDEMQQRQKLSDKEIVELAKIAAKIEQHYGFPQDLEYAVDKDNLYIVQSRPITTLKKQNTVVRPEGAPRQTDAKEEKKGGANMGGAGEISKAEILVKGLGSSPGVGVGKVKIIKDAADIKRMERGDILVTEMTSPDFVPAMKKAAAIITDTGGMTCFEGSTKILTRKGFMAFEEVYAASLEGESFEILSYDYSRRRAKWKRIIAVGRRKSDIIRITISQTGKNKYNYLDVTEDHKMYTFDGRDLVKKPLNKILDNEEGICVIDRIPSEDFASDPRMAYLVGAIFTDGYFKVDQKHGVVLLTQKDTEEKREFINSVKSNFTDVFGYGMDGERIKTNSGYLRGRLIEGEATDFICYKKEAAAAFSRIYQNAVSWVQHLDEESTLQFLAGFADGDGSFCNNRLQLYVGEERLLQTVLLACLKLGISPQITRNRTIYNVQILERMGDILSRSKRLNRAVRAKVLGTKLFAAKQVIGDIVDSVNWGGKIKPYVENNLYIDARKIEKYVLPMASPKERERLMQVLDSNIRMKRAVKEDDLGEGYVYNVEVGSEDEMDKNYVVFSKLYSPILVSNSHAAIVSRELGVPCVVGTGNATAVLKEGMEVSVDGTHGIVYAGIVNIATPPVEAEKGGAQAAAAESVPVTGTKIYVNLANVDLAEKVAQLPCDGVGLLRAEFMIADIGAHPKKMLEDGKENEFIDKLAEDMRRFAAAFYPRPVVYRATDFKTNEYRNLPGGEKYEPHEDNPMMGWRGAARYITDPAVFKMELKAIKKVREEYHLPNLWLMIPFVRRIGELRAIKQYLHEVGIYRTRDFKLWIMVEVPSTVFLIDQFCEEGIDGISIGTNDLTQLILGIDRDNATMAKGFDERNEAVLRALKQVITTCKRYGVTTSLCGQAPSVYPEFAEKLVEFGTTSMSVNPDAVVRTRRIVASAEQKIILERLSKLGEAAKSDSAGVRLEDD
jgi:pyruvate,water dikinase